MKQFNRFDRTGKFNCRSCKRSTRNTGDNGDVRLCPQCCEVSGLENTLSDGAFDQVGLTEQGVKDYITKLCQEAVELGGVIAGYNKVAANG